MVDLETSLSCIQRLLLLLLLTLSVSTQNCTCAHKNETVNDRTGLIDAVPEEQLVYKNVTTCQGQKMYISCSNIYDRIQIQTSVYGREDFTTCKHPELPSDKLCAEQNATVQNVVKDLCQGESRCEVAVTNDFLAQFGTIICPNIYKYLYVKYRCVPKSALPDVPTIPESATTRVTTTTTTGAATAPVQCCYVVPGTSTALSTTTESVGGTIIRNKGGTQSVEERIISEKPQPLAFPNSTITEIIHGEPEQPASSPNNSVEIQSSNLTQPSTSQLGVRTLLQAQGKKLGMSNLISIDPSQLGRVLAKPSEREYIPKRIYKRKITLRQITLRRKGRKNIFRIHGSRDNVEQKEKATRK